jgi:TatD DNase family protein
VLTDTHCHLDFDRFDQDREQVVSQAREVGIHRLLNPGINLESSRTAISLADKYPEVYAAVGVHPNDGASWKEESNAALRALADHPKVVAIGEIGLDYYRDWTPRDLQVEIFKAQLDIAADLKLPVVIHCREAMEDILTILSDWQSNLDSSGSPLAKHPGVLHSFSGNQINAEQVQDINFSIGITGPVTFDKAVQLQALVKQMPGKAILIETDAPFLTPHPYRGKRNEPARVKLVAEKIAELREEAYNTIANNTTENAAQLFGW